MTGAEQLTDPCTDHGEGPFWDAGRDRLLVLDMLAGAVVELPPSGSPLRHELGGVVATIRARRGDGYVVATERGFRLLDAGFAPDGPEIVAFADPGVRMNDGGCDPQGRFYCGSMAYDETPGAGAVYRLDPDRSVRLVRSGVTISNGLEWHADGRHAYYADTPTGRVDLLDFDAESGTFTGGRPFAEIAPHPGLPDGLALDEEGGVWVALWGGGAVHRYDPAGRLTERVELPVRQVTACAFGGPERRTLYVTTSRHGRGPDAEPAAGAVFAYAAGVRGAEVFAFAG